MNDLIKLLKRQDGFICIGKSTAEDIHNAEKVLSVSFAEDYRKYVESFGAVSFMGHEWTGITNVKRLNVVEVTNQERAHRTNIPKNWYVVEQTHFDDVVYWQDEKGTIFKTGSSEKAMQVASGLCDYLNSII